MRADLHGPVAPGHLVDRTGGGDGAGRVGTQGDRGGDGLRALPRLTAPGSDSVIGRASPSGP